MRNKKLRILVLNYDFPPMGGGAAPVSYEISKGYAKLGHKVDVVTMHFKDLPFFEKKDGMNIYRVKCMRAKKEITHPWEQYSYIVSAKKFLREHLKENSYDVCHCHFIIPTGVVALWLKKKYGLYYVITAHGSDVLGYNDKRGYKYLYPLIAGKWRKIVREAKLIVSPSKFLAGKIAQFTDAKVKVVQNGIDGKKFKPLKKEKKILIVTKLQENKGVQDVLDALKGVDLRGWGVEIVGEGTYRAELEKKSKENGLGNVRFRGWVDNNSKEMKELYGKASIFISASHFENMSIVLLEALASGCRVIAANVGGNPEFILKESLFEVKNIEELKRKIIAAMSGKLERGRLERKFNWNEIVKSYLGVLVG